MNFDKAIKESKDENEQCYEQCEGHCLEVINNVCTCRDATILSALGQYRAIGTVEEFREGRERQIPKKPMRIRLIETSGVHCGICPICKNPVYADLSNKNHREYCGHCGQSIDWR